MATYLSPYFQNNSTIKPNLFTYPNQVPLYTTPAVTTLLANAAITQPQQQQQNTGQTLGTATQQTASGRDPHINPATGVWDDNYFASLQSGAPAPSEADLNSIYQPLMSSLADQEQSASGQLADTLSGLSADQQTQEKQLKDAQSAQQAVLDQQTTNLNSDKSNALASARQAYNELTQSNLARFGSTNSTGLAASEILGRNTQTSFNNIETQYMRGVQDINNRLNDLNRYTDTKLQEVGNSYAQAIAQAKAAFQDQVNQINAQRNSLESDKAAKRYQALLDRQQYIRSLDTWRLQTATNLAVWRAQQEASLKGSLAQLPQALTSDQFLGYSTPIGQEPARLTAGSQVYQPSTTPTSNTGMTFANSMDDWLKRLGISN